MACYRKQGIRFWTAVLLCLLACIAVPFSAKAQVGSPQNWAEILETIAAEHVVLMNADTGQVLFEKAMTEQAAPASITKIMTGLLVLEHGSTEDKMIASATAVDILPGSTAMWLEAGEVLTVDEAMYAMMLRSANDAANLLAEYVAGSQEEFASLMNRRARELGAKNTNFANASGLPDPSHYTTAYDMAVITRAASQNTQFLHYFGSDSYLMSPTNIAAKRLFTNGQSMLLSDSAYYSPEVLGGKVGYTNEARHTMVTIAQRDGRTLICVVMGCGREEKFTDTRLLLDYGFSGFHPVIVGDTPPGELVTLLMEGGEPVGEVQWLPDQEQWELLLPHGFEAGDVAVEYRYPGQLEELDHQEAFLLLRPTVESPLLPVFLLERPMEGYTNRVEAVMATVEGVPLEDDGQRKAALLLIAVGAGGIVFGLLLGSRARKPQKTRAHRNRRAGAASNRNMA